MDPTERAWAAAAVASGRRAGETTAVAASRKAGCGPEIIAADLATGPLAF